MGAVGTNAHDGAADEPAVGWRGGSAQTTSGPAGDLERSLKILPAHCYGGDV